MSKQSQNFSAVWCLLLLIPPSPYNRMPTCWHDIASASLLHRPWCSHQPPTSRGRKLLMVVFTLNTALLWPSQDMETHGHKLSPTSVWERCVWSQVVSLHLWIKVFDHPPGCFAWNDWSFCVKKFSAITLKALLKLRTVNAFYRRMGCGLCMVRMGFWK